MKRALLQICGILTMFLFFVSCVKNKPDETTILKQQIKANPYIESFTSGVIPRGSSIYVSFNEDIPVKYRNKSELKKIFSISPDVPGNIMVEDNKKIVFTPDNPLNRGTEYKISINPGYIFDGAGTLSYNLMTKTPNLGFEDVSLLTDKDGNYYFGGFFYTNDKEQQDDINKIVALSSDKWDLKIDKVDNNRYNYTIKSKNKDNNDKEIKLRTPKNNLGYPEEDLLKMEIPQKNLFDIYSVKLNPSGKSVDVTFTQPLDQKQELLGFVTLERFNDLKFEINKNVLRVWFQNNGTTDTKYDIYDGIKSAKGEVLKKATSKKSSLMSGNINIDRNYPNVRFVSEGVILPTEGGTSVLFEAQSLKGVIVRVVRILPNNVEQFLQQNNLNAWYNLSYVGELVAKKVIFFDDLGEFDLSKRNTFGINLEDLFNVEKGNIYSVRLSYTYDLSAYPVTGRPQMTKEEIIAQANEISEEEFKPGSNDYNYLIFSDGPNVWDWKNSNNPAKEAFYNYKYICKNLISSNIGLAAKRSADSDNIVILTNDINSSAPLENVDVNVYNFKNTLIGSGRSDKSGVCHITIKEGVPYYAIATSGNEKGYLRMPENMSLSVSDFNVGGEVIQKGIKGYIYTERGVWRPGDTIFVSFILNDSEKKLPANHPVTLKLFNPQNISVIKKSVNNGVNGLYTFKVATPENAPTGIWECRISVGGADFSKRLRIESIKPNRLAVNLIFDEKIINQTKPVKAELESSWLTGASAAHLKYDINVNFKAAKTVFEQYKGYEFDNILKNFESKEVFFCKGLTDGDGNAKINEKLLVGEGAPGMLQAEFITQVYEDGGGFSIASNKMPYSPYSSYVGIKSPQKKNETLITDKNHTFDVVTLNDDGTTAGNEDCTIKVYKGYWYWWLDSYMQNIADFIASNHNMLVKTINLKTDGAGKGSFVLNFPDREWGTYIIIAKNNVSGHVACVKTYFDSNMYLTLPDSQNNQATRLNITTDKQEYNIGDEITISFPSIKDSHARISIENGSRIVESHEMKCTGDITTFKFKAKKEFTPNIYVSIILLNPYKNTTDLPLRLYGIVPLKIVDPGSLLEPVIKSPADIKPGKEFTVSVTEKNKKDMTFTLAVVDCGLLDLTRFKTPDPWNAFNAKEALGVKTWDIYDYVIGAYSGKIQKIYSIGGDTEIDNSARTGMNRFKPVVIFKGPYTLKGGKTEDIKITMPEYIGKVRCMVVASEVKKDAFGSAASDIIVKQPVMVLGTLPRNLNPGDKIKLPVTIFAMEKGVGEVIVSVSGSSILGFDKTMTQKVNFEKEGSKIVWFELDVKEETGWGSVNITARSKDSQSTWSEDIEVISNLIPVRKSETVIIEKGKSASLSMAPFGIDGSNTGTLELSSLTPLNLNKHLGYLINYPFECLEQTVSRGFPSLYISEFMSLTQEEEQKIETTIKDMIESLSQYMFQGGAFTYWKGGNSISEWGSVYALHFMTEAKKKGYKVKDDIYNEALNFQKTYAANWKYQNNNYSKNTTQAYRLYVLALADAPDRGAMNRLNETSFNYTTQSFLAAAYAEIGRKEIAQTILSSKTEYIPDDNNFYNNSFGNNLRSKAVRVIALNSVGETNLATNLVNEISADLASSSDINTQSTAFSLIAITEYYKIYPPAVKIEASVSGTVKESVNIDKPYYSFDIDMNKKQQVEISNKSTGTLYATISAVGTPSMSEQRASANGLLMEMNYSDNNNKDLDITNLELGTNFEIIATIKNISQQTISNVIVSQIIPSGWEIVSPASVVPEVSYQDIRDDKVISYISAIRPNEVIVIGVRLSASYAGEYFLPPSFCEAMYDPILRSTTAGKMIVVRQ